VKDGTTKGDAAQTATLQIKGAKKVAANHGKREAQLDGMQVEIALDDESN